MKNENQAHIVVSLARELAQLEDDLAKTKEELEQLQRDFCFNTAKLYGALDVSSGGGEPLKRFQAGEQPCTGRFPCLCK